MQRWFIDIINNINGIVNTIIGGVFLNGAWIGDVIDKSNLLAIEKKNPNEIIPIHTEQPETFNEFGLNGKVILPEKGKRYQF